MRTFCAMLKFESQKASRFPVIEAVLFLLIFRVGLAAGNGVWTLPGLAAWTTAESDLAAGAAVGALQSIDALLLPASLFAAVLASIVFAHEIEGGQMRTLLSTASTRHAVFWAKFAATFALVAAALLLTFMVGAILNGVGGLSAIRWTDIRSLAIGTLYASMMLAVTLTSLSTACAVLIPRPGAAILVAVLIPLGAEYIGEATRSTVLPPLVLTSQAGLLYGVYQDSQRLAEASTIAAVLTGASIAACAVAWARFRSLEVS